MKKEALIVISVALALISLVSGCIQQESIQKESQQKTIPSNSQSIGLGNLCFGEDECISFCLNNRGRCEEYCKGNYENELCATIFPSGPEEQSQEQLSDKIPSSIINKGLGNLCTSEEECIDFCLNNSVLCKAYCKENQNELCLIVFTTGEPSVEKQTDAGIKQDICEGTKTKFDYPPVNLDKTLVMLPRGLMVGDHVTPVNHHYFQSFENKEFDIEVYSPGDGFITDIGHMPGAEEGKDYNMIIEHACALSSHYIYVSNLPEKIKAYAPPTHGYRGVRIPIAAGELIGYYKYNLDYNLIDEKVTLTGFVLPEHYAVEPYKKHIVRDTYEYSNEPVRSKLIKKSIRTAEPISGKIDYDIDGRLVGNWFLEGTNGYAGAVTEIGGEGHWLGHLSIVYDYIDPERVVISIGGYGGEDSKQFGVKGNSPNPADVSIRDGLIKYELIEYDYIAPNGDYWDRISLVKGLKTVSRENVHGVVLVQMIEDRKIKFEAFPEKTASQVNGFTENAKIYER